MQQLLQFFQLGWSVLITTPWKVSNELVRWLAMPCHQLLIWWSGIDIGPQWRWYGQPIIQRHRGSQIKIGAGVELRSSASSNPLSPQHPVVISTRSAHAMITIGKQVGMTGGSIVAAEKVVIGDRVIIGANTTIMDTDFHPLAAEKRRQNLNDAQTKAVVIGDDVFIGAQTLILKGSTIGARSVIGAGSVVSGYVPADVIAVGNPARVIKKV